MKLRLRPSCPRMVTAEKARPTESFETNHCFTKELRYYKYKKKQKKNMKIVRRGKRGGGDLEKRRKSIFKNVIDFDWGDLLLPTFIKGLLN